ncbi:tRNA (cytidine(34)-2'-O)-methyltransferase [bacterium]|nr:tRNA (cytidine(34)-2'-O)-methyltransferase [bacterium]
MNNFPHFNIVLVQPEIPPNTGNIGRTCVATGASLHLVKPLGFEITDRALKRAGLDYWDELDFHVHESLEDFLTFINGAPLVMATKKTGNIFTDHAYVENQYILFGSESLGLPEWLIEERKSDCITIPMKDNSKIRSLNLANSVSIVLFEAIKQCSDNFKSIIRKEFHKS